MMMLKILFSGNGLGSLVAGQLLGKTSLETPGLFQWSAGLSSSIGLAIIIAYHVIGQKCEKKIVADKTALLERVKAENEKSQDNLGLEICGIDKRPSLISYAGSWASESMLSNRFS